MPMTSLGRAAWRGPFICLTREELFAVRCAAKATRLCDRGKDLQHVQIEHDLLLRVTSDPL